MFKDITTVGNFAVIDQRNVVARGLQINLREHRHVVEQCRNDRGDNDLGIGTLKNIGHQKGDGPHNRRHDLPAGGGDGFNGGSLMAAITGGDHHADRHHAGGDDIGDHHTRDRTEQAGGDHGNFRRSATAAAHQCACNIVEEIGAA